MSVQQRSGRDRQVGETLDLREYLEPVIRQRRLILVVALITFGVAFIYTFARPAAYTSTATVLVKPTGVNLADLGPLGTEKLVNTDTEMQIVRSTVVAEQAASSTNTDLTPAQLLKHVSVSAVPNAQTLEISYSDSNPLVARQGASAFADAYLEYRQQQAQALVDSQLEGINASLKVDKARLQKLNEVIASSPRDSAAARNARAQRDSVSARVGMLEDKVTAGGLLNTDPGDVIVDAQAPGGPSSPNHLLDLAVGLLLGLAAGVVIASVRGRMDQRLHTTADLEEALGAPLLASIPWVADGGDGLTAPVSTRDPEAPASEAYRALRTTLTAVAHRGEGTLMVVSALPGDGKTTVAANLSVALAAADKRVVLVSADMRRPRIHEMFGLPNDRGLSNILTGQVPADLGVLDLRVENLYVCPGGPTPPNPVELLQSQRMRDLVSELRGLVEYVVLDCPPVLTVADSLVLASLADGVIFVVDERSTKRSAVAEARRRLEQVGAKVLGGVLNKVPPPGPHGYGYGYGYGEAKGGAESKPTSKPVATLSRAGMWFGTSNRTGDRTD
jgi:non-specific protein-tyrosine kinase